MKKKAQTKDDMNAFDMNVQHNPDFESPEKENPDYEESQLDLNSNI